MAIATDDFNRGSLGADWTNAIGTLTINSNRITGASANDCAGFFNARTFAADQYSQGVVILGVDWVGVAVRVSANNAYKFYVVTTQWELVKIVSGSFAIISEGSRTFATNDVLRLEVERTTLRAYHNGALIASASDSSLSSGAPGVAFWSGDASHDSFVDNWEGGDLHNELIGWDTRYLVGHSIYRR